MSSVRLPTEEKHYRGKFPYFARPKAIGEYTVDINRKIKLGRSNAKYFYEKALGDVNFDLNKGFDLFDEKEGGEKLDMLLKWMIQMAPDGQNLKKVLHETEFVSWRGLLTVISCTPFNTRDHWVFEAVRQKDIIFLCEESSPQKIQREATKTDRDKLMTYWGHKFEKYITADNIHGEPGTSGIVNTREEFAVVSTARIQPKHGATLKLVYGAEIDAINSNAEIVEMKTQRQALEGGFWRQKSLKWWLQSYLVGIEDIVVGFRDDNGNVFKVDVTKVDTLPQRGQWDSATCINFLGSVLAAVRNLLRTDGMRCRVVYEGRDVHIDIVPPTTPDFLSNEFKVHFGIGELG